MKQTLKWNQLKSRKDLHGRLELLLFDRLYRKKHKAYYLFAVLFSEAWWLKDNVRMVRKAVRNNTLHLIKDKLHPDEQDDDNIDIYFLEEGNGKFNIVLLYNPCHRDGKSAVLDIIPVKSKDYQMTQIHPARPCKSAPNKYSLYKSWWDEQCKKPRLLLQRRG
jgi:hypothetical protein